MILPRQIIFWVPVPMLLGHLHQAPTQLVKPLQTLFLHHHPMPTVHHNWKMIRIWHWMTNASLMVIPKNGPFRCCGFWTHPTNNIHINYSSWYWTPCFGGHWFCPSSMINVINPFVLCPLNQSAGLLCWLYNTKVVSPIYHNLPY